MEAAWQEALPQARRPPRWGSAIGSQATPGLSARRRRKKVGSPGRAESRAARRGDSRHAPPQEVGEAVWEQTRQAERTSRNSLPAKSYADQAVQRTVEIVENVRLAKDT